MRFFSTLAAVATLGFVSAQEALRFGVVNVSPSTVKVGDTLTVTYNSTLARFKPQNVDVYIQGSISSTRNTPQILLKRNDYAADQKVLTFDVTVPPVGVFNAAEGWTAWAFITFPADGVVEYGGTSDVFTITK